MIYQKKPKQTRKTQTAQKAPSLDQSTDFNEGISELGLSLQFLRGLTGSFRSESGKMQEEVIFSL